MKWTDGKRRGPLEKQIFDFVDGLIEAGATMKKREAEKLQREREWHEREAMELEQRRLREERRLKLESLLEEVAAWKQVRDFHEYMAALRLATDSESRPFAEALITEVKALVDEANPLHRRLATLKGA